MPSYPTARWQAGGQPRLSRFPVRNLSAAPVSEPPDPAISDGEFPLEYESRGYAKLVQRGVAPRLRRHEVYCLAALALTALMRCRVHWLSLLLLPTALCTRSRLRNYFLSYLNVPLERFELPTSWFVAKRSIQLSYRGMGGYCTVTDALFII